MDLKLKDGCYVVSNAGGFATVNGYEELAQRISMKLAARRGGFALLPEFGSRLYLLGNTRVSEWEATARQYVAEALADEDYLELESLSVSGVQEGSIRITTEFTYRGDRHLQMTTTI